jgi:hypothetical protein
MADRCPVCNRPISYLTRNTTVDGINLHLRCLDEFNENPTDYGARAKTLVEEQARDQRIKEREDKSVYIKDGVDINSFDMPFGEMVAFIFKWTMASIPTAIFLAILFLIFTAIFA